MPATDRLIAEQQFHDRQAEERAAWFEQHPAELRFDPDAYLDHESWIRPAFDWLGPLTGLDMLDFGCGHGMAAVVLADAGARVTAFDLSAGYLREAQSRAEANAVSVNFLQADGHRLPFTDASFDRIWGNAVLHHLDMDIAAEELFRVLRPGGMAVFCEPWGENPLLRFARTGLGYSGKDRTVDEEPFRWRHVRLLRAVFPRMELRGFQLLSMARRVLPAGKVVRTLNRCDEMLLRRYPALQRFCRYMVFKLFR